MLELIRSDTLAFFRGGRYARPWRIEPDLHDYLICTLFRMPLIRVGIHANGCVRNISVLYQEVIMPLEIQWNNSSVAMLGDSAKRMQLIAFVLHIHRFL